MEGRPIGLTRTTPGGEKLHYKGLLRMDFLLDKGNGTGRNIHEGTTNIEHFYGLKWNEARGPGVIVVKEKRRC